MTGREELPGETGDTGGYGLGWLLIRRAVAVTRRWNARYPEAPVPVEWAEEAARAFAMAQSLGASEDALDWQRRGLEFTEKLPIELVEAIFGGRDLP